MQKVCVRSIGQLGLPAPLIPFRHGFQNLFDILKNLSPEFLKFLIETNTDTPLNPIKRGSKLLKFGVMITEFSTELSQPDMGLSHPLIQGLSSDRSCIEYKFRQCLRKLGRVTDCSRSLRRRTISEVPSTREYCDGRVRMSGVARLWTQ